MGRERGAAGGDVADKHRENEFWYPLSVVTWCGLNRFEEILAVLSPDCFELNYITWPDNFSTKYSRLFRVTLAHGVTSAWSLEIEIALGVFYLTLHLLIDYSHSDILYTGLKHFSFFLSLFFFVWTEIFTANTWMFVGTLNAAVASLFLSTSGFYVKFWKCVFTGFDIYALTIVGIVVHHILL